MLAALHTAIGQPKTHCDELPGRRLRYSREPRQTPKLDVRRLDGGSPKQLNSPGRNATARGPSHRTIHETLRRLRSPFRNGTRLVVS